MHFVQKSVLEMFRCTLKAVRARHGPLALANNGYRFAAGCARRTAKRKQGKNIWGPLPGLCSRAERRFIFYPSSLTSSPNIPMMLDNNEEG